MGNRVTEYVCYDGYRLRENRVICPGYIEPKNRRCPGREGESV
jgi:hypothetical protein